VSEVLQALKAGVCSQSVEETGTLARRLAPRLPEDLVLCLNGPIGAGKTSFTSALAQALGAESTVTSPTYNLLSVYKTATRTILHLDAYRLDEETNGDSLTLEDLMQSPWLLIVEWSENIPTLLPPQRWWLSFEITDENERLLTLEIPEKINPV
jgi:tRNA threonylcarbamoyladenosine biosynthesis protein TsaE